MSDVIENIKVFNQGRDALLLNIKYERMSEDVFRFLRGSNHLFIQDNFNNPLLLQSPSCWICGDMHLENFGAYKANDRNVHFDINDFDDAGKAPVLFDVSRFLLSIVLSHYRMGFSQDETDELAKNALESYVKELNDKNSTAIGKNHSKGIIGELLHKLENRNRKHFLDSRCLIENNTRKILLVKNKTLPVSEALKEEIASALSNWANLHEAENNLFFKVHDVVMRIAGTGSIGLERYAILIEGKGSPDKNYLLEIKFVSATPLSLLMKQSSHHSMNDAERVVFAQKNLQKVPPAMLDVLDWNGKKFVMKELQPSEDKIDIILFRHKTHKLKKAIEHFAQILARDHLNSMNKGLTGTDELRDFAKKSEWQGPLLDFCKAYAEKVKDDYQVFLSAYRKARSGATGLIEEKSFSLF